MARNSYKEALQGRKQADEMYSRAMTYPLEVDVLYQAMENCDRSEYLVLLEEQKIRENKIYKDHKDLVPDVFEEKRIDDYRIYILKVLEDLMEEDKCPR